MANERLVLDAGYVLEAVLPGVSMFRQAQSNGRKAFCEDRLRGAAASSKQIEAETRRQQANQRGDQYVARIVQAEHDA